MIDFSGETKDIINKRMLSRVDNGLDKRDTSLISTSTATAAWEFEGAYMRLNQVQQNGSAQGAVGEYLDLKAQEQGLIRKPATYAVRKGMFDVQVPIGSRFSTINGTNSVNYIVSSYINDDGGYQNYQLTCEVPGDIGNTYTGNILPITFVQGLNAALLSDILIPGTESEEDGALRDRYYSSFVDKVFGGNIANYRQEILSIAGVGSVQIYPAWQGGLTVLCSILDSNYGVATPDLVSQVQYLICPPESGQTNPSINGYGIAPIGHISTITTATALNIDVSATVQIQSGYVFADVQNAIIGAINDYIISVCKTWGKPIVNYKVQYDVIVFYSQVLFAMLGVQGVINVTNVTVNSGTSDIICIETSALQQVPAMGVTNIVQG